MYPQIALNSFTAFDNIGLPHEKASTQVFSAFVKMYPKSTKQGQFLKFLNISENLHGRF
jgi:hypothetical protein